MTVVEPTPEGITDAVRALRSDRVIAYPTETVYGLGVNPFSAVALERLYTVKRRDPNHPVLLIAANEEQVNSVVSSVPANARALMESFWPGPLSLLFPADDVVAGMLQSAEGKVCIRITAHATARALCEAFGGPITSTSANATGHPPARSVREIELPGIALAIDGGTLDSDLVSTVYDPETDRVLREGAISLAELHGTLQE